MSRIEIDAGGRKVVIDHDGELEPIQRTALTLWEATAGPEPSLGPAIGFSAERRWTGDVRPAGNGRYGAPGPIAPVTVREVQVGADPGEMTLLAGTRAPIHGETPTGGHLG